MIPPRSRKPARSLTVSTPALFRALMALWFRLSPDSPMKSTSQPAASWTRLTRRAVTDLPLIFSPRTVASRTDPKGSSPRTQIENVSGDLGAPAALELAEAAGQVTNLPKLRRYAASIWYSVAED